MDDHPELPYVAATGIAVVGGIIRYGKIPNLWGPLLGMVALVIVASATNGSRIAPIVRAMGYLVVLGATYATIRVIIDKQTSKKAK